MILANLLSSNGFIIINKILIKAVGTDAAILLGELCSEYNYWENKNKLVEGKWFYSTRENIEENTGLTEHKQRQALKKLIGLKLVEITRKGIPCKNYYKLNEKEILKCYSNTQKSLAKAQKNSVVEKFDNNCLKNETSGNGIIEQQELGKFDINNNNINNKINNNIHTQEKILTEEPKKQFAKLVTLTEKEYQDLIKEYGEITTNQLIEQLNLYKQVHGKSYKSDYTAIKIWVIKRVKKMQNYNTKCNEKNNNMNNKNNYSQREYAPDFFDSLYANKKWT